MPKRKTIHAEYREDAKYAFVPAENGRFIRTHISAAWVDCPTCKVKRREPCIGKSGNMVTKVHNERMARYRMKLQTEAKRGR